MVIPIDNLLLIVPAYNEEESLASTIETLKKQPHDFVIINDGSKDRTSEIARQNAVPVIDLPFNQGLAGAFLTGMQYAKAHGYRYALQFDADGQHLPQYIEPMMNKMVQTNSDIIIGSRFLEDAMPVSLRTFGSIIIRAMIKLTSGQRLTDPTSGMRLYNERMIQLFAEHTDLTPEPDSIAYLINNGTRVGECPVTMCERVAGTSYLSSWSAAKYMCRMAFSILMIQAVRAPIAKKEVVH